MIYSSHTKHSPNPLVDEPVPNTKSDNFQSHKTNSEYAKKNSVLEKPQDTNVTLKKPNAKLNLLLTVTKKHFPNINLQKNRLLFSTLEVFSQFSCFMIVGSGFTLLVKPERKLAISNNFDAFLNLYSQADFYLAQMTSIQVLSDEEFEAMTQQLQRLNTTKKIGLNSLLWQIYNKILPFGFDADTNHLDIKVKYMPNFSIMSGTPVFYKNILASCLLQSKNIQQLNTLFPEVSIEELDRLFLIAIYSDVIDLNALQVSHKNSIAIESAHIKESAFTNKGSSLKTKRRSLNKGVQKAKKNNFLTRILKKLSL